MPTGTYGIYSSIPAESKQIVFLDRAKETISTTGSGSIVNLAGPVQGFQALSGIGYGDYIPYYDGFDYCADADGREIPELYSKVGNCGITEQLESGLVYNFRGYGFFTPRFEETSETEGSPYSCYVSGSQDFPFWSGGGGGRGICNFDEYFTDLIGNDGQAEIIELTGLVAGGGSGGALEGSLPTGHGAWWPAKWSYYAIEDGTDWEVGLGYYKPYNNTQDSPATTGSTKVNQWVRHEVYDSSLIETNTYGPPWARYDVTAAKKINLQGTASIFLTVPASKVAAFDSGNFMGLGTATNPQYELDVAGTSNTTTLRVTPSDTNFAPLQIQGSSNVAIQFSDGTKQDTSPTGDITTLSGLSVVGGDVTTIQFNESGSFSGNSTLKFNTSVNSLILSGNPLARDEHANLGSNITIGSGAGTGLNALNTVIIGQNSSPRSTANGGSNVLIGNDISVSTGGLTVAIGQNIQAPSTSVIIGPSSTSLEPRGSGSNISMGYDAGVNYDGSNHIAIGTLAGNHSDAKGVFSTMLGYGANSKGSYSTSIGGYAGYGNPSGVSKSLSIGHNTSAGTLGVAIGYQADAPTSGFVVSMGSSSTDMLLSGTFKNNLNVTNARLGINSSSPTAMADIISSSNTNVGLRVQSAASQTANLASFEDAVGGSLLSINKSGSIETTGNIASTGSLSTAAINFNTNIEVTNPSTTGTIKIGHRAGPTGLDIPYYLYIGNDNASGTGTFIRGDMDNRQLNIGMADSGFYGNTLRVIPKSSYHIPIAVQGASGQAVNLSEWQDKDRNVITSVDPTGRVSASGGLVLPPVAISPTSNTLYNVGGVLYFNGSGVNGGGGGGSYNYWTLQGDAATTTNVNTTETVQFTGVGGTVVALGGTDNRIVTISGGGGGTTYTAGTGLTLVGTEFNTAGTGYFDGITITNGGDINLDEDQRIYFEADKGTWIETDSADRLRFVAGSKQLLVLDQDTGDRAVFGYGTKVGINIGNNTTPAYDLDVSGVGRFTDNLLATGLIIGATGIQLHRNTPATTTDKLYNVGGALYFNGSAVDGDTTYTAGTGLTLVGTQFSTSGTGLFSHIQFGEASGTITAPIRIGNSVGGSDYSIAIGYKALEDIAATTTSNIGIGYLAGDGLENTSQYNTIVGYSAATAASGDSNTYLGPYAATSQKADNSISIGYGAGLGASGNKNVYIGFQAGRNVNPGSNNIDITIDSDGIEEMDGLDSKLNIYNIIRGDASSKRIAIGNLGTTDYTPDATLEVKPKEHTDIGLIVQGDASHSANLTEWQNSSEGIRAYVAADGSIATSGTVSATGGMVIGGSSKLMWIDDDGDDNGVRIGYDAGIMGGVRNVCIGQYAGNGSNGGDYNVGIGRYACGSVGGDYNAGIGYQAGQSSDGDHNISLGYRAGYQMSASSDYNQCIGYQAGRSADGDFNVFLGTHAGYNSDGTRNIYIGYQAGLEADPGSNNIEIITNSVYDVKSSLDGLSNKINIENTIMGDTAANKIVIGTGTTAQTANYSPAATLEIKPKETTDAALIVHSSGLSNVFSVSGTNVSIEGRLLGPISAPVLQDTNATVNVALTSGNYHEVELAAAVTKVIFKEGIVGQRFMVRFAQPAGANYTIAWTNVDVDEGGTGGTVSWAAGGTAPTMTATNGKADTYGFIQRSATTFDGFVVGQNI